MLMAYLLIHAYVIFLFKPELPAENEAIYSSGWELPYWIAKLAPILQKCKQANMICERSQVEIPFSCDSKLCQFD